MTPGCSSRRSAFAVRDGGVGEGEPGADGGQGHPGGPADVQRSRRGNTTGEQLDESMKI